MRFEDQPVKSIEQRPVLGGDGVDVVPHGVVHRSIMRNGPAIGWSVRAWFRSTVTAVGQTLSH